MQNMQEMLGKMFGGRTKPRKMTRRRGPRRRWSSDEADKLLDQEALTRDAVANAENNGIVFLDEIDKVCARGTGRRAAASAAATSPARACSATCCR